MEIVTAVLSGTRTLELRVFSAADAAHVSSQQEIQLTRRLCRLMDRHYENWQW